MKMKQSFTQGTDSTVAQPKCNCPKISKSRKIRKSVFTHDNYYAFSTRRTHIKDKYPSYPDKFYRKPIVDNSMSLTLNSQSINMDHITINNNSQFKGLMAERTRLSICSPSYQVAGYSQTMTFDKYSTVHQAIIKRCADINVGYQNHGLTWRGKLNEGAVFMTPTYYVLSMPSNGWNCWVHAMQLLRDNNYDYALPTVSVTADVSEFYGVPNYWGSGLPAKYCKQYGRVKKVNDKYVIGVQNPIQLFDQAPLGAFVMAGHAFVKITLKYIGARKVKAFFTQQQQRWKQWIEIASWSDEEPIKADKRIVYVKKKKSVNQQAKMEDNKFDPDTLGNKERKRLGLSDKAYNFEEYKHGPVASAFIETYDDNGRIFWPSEDRNTCGLISIGIALLAEGINSELVNTTFLGSISYLLKTGSSLLSTEWGGCNLLGPNDLDMKEYNSLYDSMEKGLIHLLKSVTTITPRTPMSCKELEYYAVSLGIKNLSHFMYSQTRTHFLYRIPYILPLKHLVTDFDAAVSRWLTLRTMFEDDSLVIVTKYLQQKRIPAMVLPLHGSEKGYLKQYGGNTIYRFTGSILFRTNGVDYIPQTAPAYITRANLDLPVDVATFRKHYEEITGEDMEEFLTSAFKTKTISQIAGELLNGADSSCLPDLFTYHCINQATYLPKPHILLEEPKVEKVITEVSTEDKSTGTIEIKDDLKYTAFYVDSNKAISLNCVWKMQAKVMLKYIEQICPDAPKVLGARYQSATTGISQISMMEYISLTLVLAQVNEPLIVHGLHPGACTKIQQRSHNVQPFEYHVPQKANYYESWKKNPGFVDRELTAERLDEKILFTNDLSDVTIKMLLTQLHGKNEIFATYLETPSAENTYHFYNMTGSVKVRRVRDGLEQYVTGDNAAHAEWKSRLNLPYNSGRYLHEGLEFNTIRRWKMGNGVNFVLTHISHSRDKVPEKEPRTLTELLDTICPDQAAELRNDDLPLLHCVRDWMVVPGNYQKYIDANQDIIQNATLWSGAWSKSNPLGVNPDPSTIAHHLIAAGKEITQARKTLMLNHTEWQHRLQANITDKLDQYLSTNDSILTIVEYVRDMEAGESIVDAAADQARKALGHKPKVSLYGGRISTALKSGFSAIDWKILWDGDFIVISLLLLTILSFYLLLTRVLPARLKTIGWLMTGATFVPYIIDYGKALVWQHSYPSLTYYIAVPLLQCFACIFVFLGLIYAALVITALLIKFQTGKFKWPKVRLSRLNVQVRMPWTKTVEMAGQQVDIGLCNARRAEQVAASMLFGGLLEAECTVNNAFENAIFRPDAAKLEQVRNIVTQPLPYAEIKEVWGVQGRECLEEYISDTIYKDERRPKIKQVVYTNVHEQCDRHYLPKMADAGPASALWAFFLRHCGSKNSVDPKMVPNFRTFVESLGIRNQLKAILKGQSFRTVPRGNYVPETFEQYLREVEPHKRKDYLKSYESFRQRPYLPNTYKCNPKAFERAMKAHGEITTATGLKGRNLFNPHGSIKAVLGHLYKNFLKMMKQTTIGDSIIQGMNCDELASDISYWWSVIPEPVGVVWDGSNHDSNQWTCLIDMIDLMLLFMIIEELLMYLGYSRLEIHVIVEACKKAFVDVKFEGRAADEGLKGFAKIVQMIVRIYGTVFSGHPGRTTLGNTERVIIFILFIATQVPAANGKKLVYKQTFMLFQAGDDSYLIISRPFLALFEETFFKYYARKEGRHGIGQLAREFKVVEDIVDFLSKEGVAHHSMTVVGRKLARVATGCNYSAKLEKKDMPDFVKSQIKQLDSWAPRGLPGLEQIRAAWVKHATKKKVSKKVKEQQRSEKWHELVQAKSHVQPLTETHLMQIDPMYLVYSVAPHTSVLFVDHTMAGN